MDTLDSRSLRNIDCFAQKFSAPGTVYYQVGPTSGLCLPIEKESAYVITIRPREGDSKEGDQHSVTIRQEGRSWLADPPRLEIQDGDTVLWNSPDPLTSGFAVRGEGDGGDFDSAALTSEAVYTHAFGTPGEYKWVDANGGEVSGTVAVRNLDLNDPEQCRKWVAALSEGALIMIRGNRAEPEGVEILTGQTVFWAIERASGISITDARLVSHQISFVRQYDLSELQRSLTRSMQG